MSEDAPVTPADSDGHRIGRRRHEATGLHATHGHAPQPKNRKELAWLSLGALGVVYGDIGTSPLYAMRECLSNEHFKVAPDAGAVLGIVSLFFWSLTLVIVGLCFAVPVGLLLWGGVKIYRKSKPKAA